MKALDFHPIADLVPRMADEDYHALRRDVRQHGVRVPIVLYEGRVLDGRNRAMAWFDVHNNWQVPSIEFEGTPEQAIDFVRSHNIARRHLKPSQKSYFESQAAAFLKPSKGGRPAKRTSANLDRLNQREIAKAAGVSRNSIANAAKAVKLGGEDVASALRNGRVSVNRALAIAKMPERKRASALEDRSVPVPKTKPSPKGEFAEYNRGVEAAARLASRRLVERAVVDEIRALKR